MTDNVIRLQTPREEARAKMYARLDELRRAIESGEIDTLYTIAVTPKGEWWSGTISAGIGFSQLIGILSCEIHDLAAVRPKPTFQPMPGSDE